MVGSSSVSPSHPLHLKTLFLLTDDARDLAIQCIGRPLSDDELHRVQKGLESGLGCWDEVMRIAIAEATSQS